MAAAIFVVLGHMPVAAGDFRSPDILVLGDSQISFGSGPVLLDFFQNIDTHCGMTPEAAKDLERLGDKAVAVIGVRSTSLRSWAARKGSAKGSICDVDKKWKANAGTFGTVNTTENKYVQIGKGPQYQFCKKGQSAFEAMFTKGYYEPKLLIMTFLGNSAHRWSADKYKALEDVEATMSQLPEGLPCIFMTTAPSYTKKSVALRLKAQENVKYAFSMQGSRCSFVEGFTPETIDANQGNRLYFRRNKSGRVKDPFHPNEKAAENFIMVRTPDICRAVIHQMSSRPSQTASLPSIP
ncbi:SGNH/GDSL hydrolase family protein [Roseovarius sp. 2305UL8-3]|uniref:SGNH/GDSL hydrolase family protein n=1 Tax=Roseovarius conchicola TaxID=3121636 RepID=UPI0035293189